MEEDPVLVVQPERALGETLKAELLSGRWRRCDIAVAWTRRSGVLVLRDAFCQFLSEGNSISITSGVSFGNTTREGLEELLALRSYGALSPYVFHNEAGTVFHPKLYLFTNEQDALLYIGSNNLTGSGLYRNDEVAVGLALPAASPTIASAKYAIARWQDVYSGLAKALTQDLIHQLVSGNYIQTEAQVHTRSATAGRPSNFAPVFGSAPPPPLPLVPNLGHAAQPPLPELPNPAYAPPPPAPHVPVTDGAAPPYTQTAHSAGNFWVQTGALTGGSRNQLDLSMITQHGRLQGSVSLFGIDPNDTGTLTEVTIRFQHQDYIGNTIKFPETSEGRSNGTWRLQLNGTDGSGSTLTRHCDAFRYQILIFQRLGINHYEIVNVVDLENLDTFKSMSTVWDENRGTSTRPGRAFGIF